MGEKVMNNKQVILASYANEGSVTQDHLNIIETQLDIKGCKQGEVIVKNMWISVDPYLRNRMKNLGSGSFMQSFKLGQVKVLKEEFGFDDAFNYKSETDWDATLSKYFPKGIDIYFENVGGRMLEAVLNHINMNARIPICGMISQYNEDWKQTYGVRNLLNLVGKCAKMQGFIVGHHLDQMDHFREEVISYTKQGKLKYRVDIKQGIDSFLETFNSMFNGKNIGKTVVRL